jgi:hypothetical protein
MWGIVDLVGPILPLVNQTGGKSTADKFAAEVATLWAETFIAGNFRAREFSSLQKSKIKVKNPNLKDHLKAKPISLYPKVGFSEYEKVLLKYGFSTLANIIHQKRMRQQQFI